MLDPRGGVVSTLCSPMEPPSKRFKVLATEKGAGELFAFASEECCILITMNSLLQPVVLLNWRSEFRGQMLWGIVVRSKPLVSLCKTSRCNLSTSLRIGAIRFFFSSRDWHIMDVSATLLVDLQGIASVFVILSPGHMYPDKKRPNEFIV